jgi:acyl carrier protein
MDFLDVFNAVVHQTLARTTDAKEAKSYADVPDELGIDSLDMVMVVAVLTDAYGIPEDIQFDNVSKFTVGTVKEYVDKHKTKDVQSLEEVMEFA